MARSALALAFLAAAALVFGPAPRAGAADEPDAKAEAERAKKVDALVERLKSADADERRGAAALALSEQDGKVTAALVRALTDADSQVRRAVIAALAARTEEHAKKDASAALLARTDRLVQYADLQVELIAVLGALHDLAQPTIVAPLVHSIDLERREPAILEARLRAIANVPTAQAIESLIDVMARGGRGNAWWKREVRGALMYATGQKFGADPDVWRKWWREEGKGFDFAAAAARRAKERAGKKK
jgi:HEAT repeat protein